MVLRVVNWGKEPIYYVQKSYRKEDGKPAPKNVERLGTMEDLISRCGELTVKQMQKNFEMCGFLA